MGRWTCKRSVQHSGLPGRQYAVESYKLTPRYPETSAFRMARDGRGQPAQLHFILLDETACDHVLARWTRAVQSFPGLASLLVFDKTRLDAESFDSATLFALPFTKRQR